MNASFDVDKNLIYIWKQVLMLISLVWICIRFWSESRLSYDFVLSNNRLICGSFRLDNCWLHTLNINLLSEMCKLCLQSVYTLTEYPLCCVPGKYWCNRRVWVRWNQKKTVQTLRFPRNEFMSVVQKTMYQRLVCVYSHWTFGVSKFQWRKKKEMYKVQQVISSFDITFQFPPP